MIIYGINLNLWVFFFLSIPGDKLIPPLLIDPENPEVMEAPPKKKQPELGLLSWFGMTIPYQLMANQLRFGYTKGGPNKKKSYQNNISY